MPEVGSSPGRGEECGLNQRAKGPPDRPAPGRSMIGLGFYKAARAAQATELQRVTRFAFLEVA